MFLYCATRLFVLPGQAILKILYIIRMGWPMGCIMQFLDGLSPVFLVGTPPPPPSLTAPLHPPPPSSLSPPPSHEKNTTFLSSDVSHFLRWCLNKICSSLWRYLENQSSDGGQLYEICMKVKVVINYSDMKVEKRNMKVQKRNMKVEKRNMKFRPTWKWRNEKWKFRNETWKWRNETWKWRNETWKWRNETWRSNHESQII